MGGPFNELGCSKCGRRFKTGETVHYHEKGTYDEQAENIEWPHWEGSQDFWCDNCWRKYYVPPKAARFDVIARVFGFLYGRGK